ncbi:MAG: hypothetical protein WBW76_03920 [Candidatus Cybelea sp.]
MRQFALKLAESANAISSRASLPISMGRAAVRDTPFGRKAYAESALAFLPSAAGEIVVDKFHIVNQLTHAVNLNE